MSHTVQAISTLKCFDNQQRQKNEFYERKQMLSITFLKVHPAIQLINEQHLMLSYKTSNST